MRPATFNLEIVRGNSRPMTFRVAVTQNGATQTWSGWERAVLTIQTPKAVIRKTTDAEGGLTQQEDGAVTWLPTVEDTRSIPSGRLTSYEFELQWASGEQRTLLAGMITGIGGINSD
ncbi:hypothetical protein SAMN05216548_13211 [Faunimonas pinastri]|uniref:Uncharacterized protein n=1 Tax=Faunimonas pinastri TaxID=1855383 RepID=A0A1H9QQT8_9HYPH|nr:hypothetical protein [Faunimonas pinastri]SER62812.1 hypothetical protein SAMN05216548_13211 [Faunimonas pinastri]